MDPSDPRLILFYLVLNAAIVCAHACLEKKERRWWVRPVNQRRQALGHFDNLFKYFHDFDHEEFFEYARLTPSQFDRIVQLVSPFLATTSMRKPLPIGLKVALTLSFLAHGGAVRSQSWNFRVGRSTAHKIIPQVCRAIWLALQPDYLPNISTEQWKEIATDIFQKWHFPNCVGAIDGKHIKIKAPPNSGSQYYNYKDFFSVVLMAACDGTYKFTWVDIGQFGSISDSGVFSRTDFGAALENGEINVPPSQLLPNSRISTSHTFVGDEIFPLKMNLLRPYSRKDLGDAERIFNYRLSRARRAIENTFGIMLARWQILNGTINFSAENATAVVQALVCLHNFAMSHDGEGGGNGRRCCIPGLLDHEDEEHNNIDGNWRVMAGGNNLNDLGRLGANNATRAATLQRDTFRDYFVSPVGEAQAPWQYRCAFRGLVLNE